MSNHWIVHTRRTFRAETEDWCTSRHSRGRATFATESNTFLPRSHLTTNHPTVSSSVRASKMDSHRCQQEQHHHNATVGCTLHFSTVECVAATFFARSFSPAPSSLAKRGFRVEPPQLDAHPHIRNTRRSTEQLGHYRRQFVRSRMSEGTPSTSRSPSTRLSSQMRSKEVHVHGCKPTVDTAACPKILLVAEAMRSMHEARGSSV